MKNELPLPRPTMPVAEAEKEGDDEVLSWCPFLRLSAAPG